MEEAANVRPVDGDIGVPVIHRLLHPLPQGAFEQLLRVHLGDGQVVLDPFARGDTLARAATKLGKRAIIIDGVPLLAFSLNALLEPLPARELHRAFTWLGNSRIGDTLLRIHIDELYATTCPRCGQPAIAQSFFWRDNRLAAKACACDYCRYQTDAANGLDAADDADFALLARIDGLTARSRLYQRFPAGTQAAADVVSDLLNLYTLRAHYAIDLLLTAIERGAETPQAEAALKFCLLHALNAGRKLAPVAAATSSLPVLHAPAEFRERNLWQAFEEGYEQLRRLAEARAARPAPPAPSPALDRSEGGEVRNEVEAGPKVVVIERAAVDLGPRLAPGSLDLILAEAPRHDRAPALALLALWSGWLLGGDHSDLLVEAYTEAQTPDWGSNLWPRYFGRVRDALAALRPALRDGAAAVLICESDDPLQAQLVALAAAAGGLTPTAVTFIPLDAASLARVSAYGGAPGAYALRCLPAPAVDLPPAGSQRELAQEIGALAREMAASLLLRRNEPVAWSWLNAAPIEHLGTRGTLARLSAHFPDNPAGAIRLIGASVRDALESAVRRDAIIRLEVERELGGGILWALPTVSGQQPPLTERVERSVYNVLATTRAIADAQLDAVIERLYGGHTEPEPGLVREILSSYAVLSPTGGWTLRIGDSYQERTLEHRRVLGWLVELGHRMGFHVWVNRNEHRREYRGTALKDLLTPTERGFDIVGWLKNPRAEEIDVVWYGPSRPTLIFEVEWMATITDAVLRRRTPQPDVRRYLIVPRDRLALLRQRLARNTLLRQTVQHDGWQIVDYTQLGALDEDMPDLERLQRLLGLEGLRLTASA